jgi:carboxylesterase
LKKTTGEKIKDVLKIAVWILAPLAFVVLVLMILPMGVPVFPPPREQAVSFDAAITAFHEVSERDRFFVNDVCVATLMHHDRKTRRVYVLMHGLTNCPAQFLRIAKALYAEGHNVMLPRMPYHGLTNRLSDDPGKLRLRDVAEWAAEALEIARGVGDEVIVAGLSVNGTTAAWIAQSRPDVKRVVIISPFYAPPGIPGFLQGSLGRFLVRIPNIFLWWDPSLKQELPGPPYVAPRFPTRVVGEFMVLGNYLKKSAGKSAPACHQIRVVLSAADPAIDLPLTKEITARWKKWPDRDVQEFIFPEEMKILHDMVDPHQPGQQLEVSEPELLRILTEK